jgi:hypothetical protein
MFGRKRKSVDELDLSAIAAGVAKRHGWPADRVKEAEHEYRKFLYLMLLNPGSTLVPWSNDLDLFWHEHILHTQEYAGDCQRLFGRFINHDPTISRDSAAETKAKARTANAYHSTFGKRSTDPTSWLFPTAASLAAIGATTYTDQSVPHSHSSCSSGAASCGGGTTCGGGGGGGGCGGGGT